MFYIATTFLDYSISKAITEVSEFEILGSTIISIDSRYKDIVGRGSKQYLLGRLLTIT